MAERRRIYAQRMEAAGLAPPDAETMHLLWQIVDEGVLGASNHVRLTQQLLAHLLRAVAEPGEAWTRAAAAAALVAETRGQEAPVVGNAVHLLLDGLDRLPAQERSSALAGRIDRWRAESDDRMERLVASAVAAIGPGRTVIAYDYSSTVAGIITRLAEVAPPAVVIVPESRAIAGGRRYLEAFAAIGIAVRFVLDAAFEHILCDGALVLLGAESVRCDGSLTNTIGSRPLARLAQWRGCEVYGCADLLKLDLRSYRGHFAVPALRRFDDLLKGAELPSGAMVSTTGPELEVVPPSLITAFLTECGPVPPAAIWQLGRETFGVRETVR